MKRKAWVDPYAIPPQLPKDRSYEWKRSAVFGQSDPSYMKMLEQQGWTRAKYKNGRIVKERDGLVLMERPTYLTRDAVREDYIHARDQLASVAQNYRLGWRGNDDNSPDRFGGAFEHRINKYTPENDWTEEAAFAAIDALYEQERKEGKK